MPDTISALERQLRRSNRILAIALFATCAITLLGMAQPATTPDAIQARAIQLIDADGAIRAELAIDEDGSAGLFVYDQDKRTRACVIHDDAQSALYLMDEAGAIRLGAAQFAHGGGGLALHGEESKGATVLYHKKTGSLTFYDDEGAVTKKITHEN